MKLEPPQENPLAKFPSVNLVDEALEKRGLACGKEVRGRLQDILQAMKAHPKYNQGQLSKAELLERIIEKLDQNGSLTEVINMTGVVLHTNLGRAPLPREFFRTLSTLGRNYSNLEFDVTTGKRGKRGLSLEQLLVGLTGAEAALVVNNNAGALVLSLAALAKGKGVVISRGELVEIGGGFRVPEILEASGAKMIEVGTTNKTHFADYEKALDNADMILKVHPSNFEIQGFTQGVALKDLSKLAKTKGKILLKDLGSGLFNRVKTKAGFTEPTIEESLKAGADLVTFSGDKLLGGPQAGIILGDKDLVDKLKSHPLYRALRLDKFTNILLTKTLQLYAQGLEEQLPVVRMLCEAPEEVKKRAEELLVSLNPKVFSLIECKAKPGGGSLPLAEIDSWGVYMQGDIEKNLKALRELSTPVIGRVLGEGVLLDCKCLLPSQIQPLGLQLGKLPC
ncbi:MAG: L-seryl-tRNA(Sec) selenium transferase [SAR324 cluster bacterium]|nr:L-seryl-tRNA(Sec) selenium transferase [SAR324 cluster bacterium]